MNWEHKKKDQKGIILIVVLWILLILSVLAIGLGRKSRVELALIKHSVGLLKSRYLAKAGLMFALDQISQDSKNPETKSLDTLYQCGVSLGEEASSEEIFKNISLGEGAFEISYEQYNNALDQKNTFWGISDEERKININAITRDNYTVIVHLAKILGIEEDIGETIAAAIVDWRDQDSKDTNPPFGAEDDYYQTLTKRYHCKNFAFDHLKELLLLKGVSREVFNQLKPFLTVFPKDAKTLLVNFNTAPEVVIQALARSVVGGETNTDQQEADDLAAKIIIYRAGDDGEEMTKDDRLVERNKMGLNAVEQVLFLAMQKNITNVSKYFSINVRGVDRTSGVTSRLRAIVFRKDLSIVEWERK